MRWADGYAVAMRVERVEEPTVFGFTWQISSLPEGAGREVYDSHTEGWPRELGELVDYLDAA
jgi:hypothetical protein